MKWNLFMIAWNSVFISFSSINLNSSDQASVIIACITIPIFIIGLTFHLIDLMIMNR